MTQGIISASDLGMYQDLKMSVLSTLQFMPYERWCSI